jgi:NAD(P)H-dependent flavin oxidoreductase YrpB (nitropropane dioxygenase family)
VAYCADAVPPADLRTLLRIEHPVVQAALGGGLSGAELAGAVSRAGGLGTVGIMVSPTAYRREIQRARELAGGKPVAANLLFPIVRRAHVEACIAERVPVVSLFFGFDRRVVAALREAGSFVLHQVGSLAEARRALADGADGLIAQGSDAGGHLLATGPLARLVPELSAAAQGRPVLAAGGIHDRRTAAAAFANGASGVCLGTRFLLTHESNAHDAYKQRLLAAQTTLVTYLFGLGWHARHRVVPNRATERWCANDPEGPAWLRAVNRAAEPLARRLPGRTVNAFIARQTVSRPFYSPAALVRGMDERLADVTPLYAGQCVSSISELVSAGEVVRQLVESD